MSLKANGARCRPERKDKEAIDMPVPDPSLHHLRQWRRQTPGRDCSRNVMHSTTAATSKILPAWHVEAKLVETVRTLCFHLHRHLSPWTTWYRHSTHYRALCCRRCLAKSGPTAGPKAPPKQRGSRGAAQEDHNAALPSPPYSLPSWTPPREAPGPRSPCFPRLHEASFPQSSPLLSHPPLREAPAECVSRNP